MFAAGTVGVSLMSLVDRINKRRVIVLGCLAVVAVIGLTFTIGMFGTVFLLSQYLQVVREMSPTASGLMMIPLVLTITFVSIISGKLITRWGRWKAWPAGGLLLVAIACGLLTTMNEETPLTLLGSYMALLGIGLSEGTAIVVKGDTFEVLGKWKVAVHDNTRFYQPWEKPYFVLGHGDVYNMKTRKVEKYWDGTTPGRRGGGGGAGRY